MKILLFGGTTEGRLLACALTQRGHQVTVSVSTPLGAEALAEAVEQIGCGTAARTPQDHSAFTYAPMLSK